MKAYAILDGGGVKGAALAGCLKAAEEQGIQFEGYGGSSAGALVATLAAVGYSADELRAILNETSFTVFLDDEGAALARLQSIPRRIGHPLHYWRHYWSDYRFVKQAMASLGLYPGRPIRTFLLKKIADKVPALRDQVDISFQELKAQGCKPVKVVATDLGTREPTVYSAAGGSELDGSVIEAVRASMSYPFVFQPVKINNRYFVDGGLCSSLPVFLFEAERAEKPLPIIAFDLVQRTPDRAESYEFGDFCSDMLASALESADFLLRTVVRNIHHVRVHVPENIQTLDFSLDEHKAEALFNAGMAATHSYFSRVVPQWAQAENDVELLQARVGVSNELVTPVLEAIGLEFERQTRSRSVRVSVTLPTGRGTRIVTYQFGMDRDPDIDLELAVAAGCSGRAWTTKRPVAADLLAAKGSFEAEWGLTREQQNKVRVDRQSMMSFPIFDVTDPMSAVSVDHRRLLGIVSVDSETALADTGWVDDRRDQAVQLGTRWADVLSRMLT
jgi:NTE family protein